MPICSNGLEKGPLQKYPKVDEMIQFQKAFTAIRFFSHGNLSSLNILIRGDGVVGISDWDYSHARLNETDSRCGLNKLLPKREKGGQFSRRNFALPRLETPQECKSISKHCY